MCGRSSCTYGVMVKVKAGEFPWCHGGAGSSDINWYRLVNTPYG